TRQDLAAELRGAGLDPGAPTFCSWLGVVPYLEPAAIRATLATVAGLSGASGGIAFDFIAPPAGLFARLVLWLPGLRVARLGEPFRAPLHPDDARRWLADAGFERIDLLDPATLNARYLGDRSDGLRASPLFWMAVARATRPAAGR